jgi:hypothetical protein
LLRQPSQYSRQEEDCLCGYSHFFA